MLDRTDWTEKLPGAVKIDLSKEKFDARLNLLLYIKDYNDIADNFRHYLVEKNPTNCEDAKNLLTERTLKSLYYETMRFAKMLMTFDEGEEKNTEFKFVSKHNEGFIGQGGKIHHVHARDFYNLCDGENVIAELEFRYNLRYKLNDEESDTLMFGVTNNILLGKQAVVSDYVSIQRNRESPIFSNYQRENNNYGLLHVELANRIVNYFLDKTAKKHGWHRYDKTIDERFTMNL